jgi:hypothetical protein
VSPSSVPSCYKSATVDAANIVLPKLTNNFVYNTGYWTGRHSVPLLYKIIIFLTHAFLIKRHFDFYKS